MVKKPILIKILFAIALLTFTNLCLAAVTASVDRSTVYMGDSLQLTIHTGNTSAKPDMSAIQNDFDILSTGQSSQVLVTQGKSYTDSIWIYVLSPKHAGNVTIPAIKVGNQASNPITVNIKPASNSAQVHADNRHVFMTASLTPDSPYVQSQAMYTLKIYYDKQIENPQLTQPNADNITFVHLGNDKTYQKNINGKSYQVLEVHFAMFPQQSGNMTIDGAIFSGNLLNQNPGQYFSNAWQAFRVAANNLQVNIKAIPANANTQWWLPAKSVSISDSWSANPDDIQAGTPITRTVTIRAMDVLANQLPEVISNKIDGFQVYPDKPTSNTTTDGRHLTAIRTEKAAYIANKAGDYTLPAVTVHWWDTDTNQPEVATLPAKKIHVIPGVATASNATPIQPVIKPAITPAQNPITAVTRFWQDKWFWLACGFLLVWMSTLGFIWWYKKQKIKLAMHAQMQTKDNHIGSIRAMRSAVKAAAQDNDYAAFAKALTALAQATWPNKRFLSLGDVIECINDNDAKSMLNELNKYLYQGGLAVTDCKQIWRAVEKEFILNKKSDNDDEPLPSLY